MPNDDDGREGRTLHSNDTQSLSQERVARAHDARAGAQTFQVFGIGTVAVAGAELGEDWRDGHAASKGNQITDQHREMRHFDRLCSQLVVLWK